MKRTVVVFLAAFTAIASACVWDRDTLAAEQKGLPDAVQIITGRFERNPPLFYQMRLDRVRRELKHDTTNLRLYDDEAVACDRMGNDVEAIAWMHRKRALFAKVHPAKEELYRTEANEGTFHVHLWLSKGSNPDDVREIKTGRDQIAKALVLNPDAHFGRERMQLGIVEWLIAIAEGKTSQRLSEYLLEKVTLKDPKKRLEGLTGLVALGSAWQSVDLFEAIAGQTGGRARHDSLGYLAILRAGELLRLGKTAACPSIHDESDLKRGKGLLVGPTGENRIRKSFILLRSEAEQWQKKRTAYMESRLKAGKHPDTDPTFWKDWHDAGPPAAYTRGFFDRIMESEGSLSYTIGVIVLMLGVVAYYFSQRSKKKAVRP